MLFATAGFPLNALAITPDGTQIIVGGERGIIVWDRATAHEVRRMTGHTTPVKALAITPDGNHIISASVGGTIRTWDLSPVNRSANSSPGTAAWPWRSPRAETRSSPPPTKAS